MQKQPRRAQVRFAECLAQMRREAEQRSTVIHERAARVQGLREELWARMDAGRPRAGAATSPPP